VRNSYSSDEIDLVAVYCGELRQCYLLPSSLACGRTSVFLRLTPPKNGQRACLNLAVDFEFEGAIAQLEERWRGTPEAAGSSPASSTPAPPETLQVGANQFRNHFGDYLEKAGEGHEVLVSRRGRPYVRVSPVEPRLELVAA
jgi:prevent-host-death family protein